MFFRLHEFYLKKSSYFPNHRAMTQLKGANLLSLGGKFYMRKIFFQCIDIYSLFQRMKGRILEVSLIEVTQHGKNPSSATATDVLFLKNLAHF